MTEQTLLIDGQPVTTMERLGWIDGASRWSLDLADGRTILATSAEITVLVRTATKPLPLAVILAYGSLFLIGGIVATAIYFLSGGN